ncbi:MAG: sodium:proton antiporter [Lachnospiraceae bacterium]|nr:sodium:proton antiporter [Lachnospiraceae bacterium]
MTLNQFLQNLPFFSIMIALISGVVCSVLPGKAAKRVNAGAIITVMILSAITLGYTLQTGTYFVYTMGHFPAPWGNEIRAGVLEALTALMFCLVMLLSLMGGYHKLDEEVEQTKVNYYYVLVNLLLTSLLALIYTNDLFTAYVFVEINTIAACGLIMIRQIGRTIEAAVRYMIMNLLGSGLLLLGICMMYGITGHLLMSNIQESVAALAASGEYHVPLLVSIALMCVGLAIKSALFPFHTWLPDAYGYSTISSAAILSSLVSKGYIFLLIKIIYRVVGFEVFQETHIVNVLFVFGLAGMIFGSLSAIRENDVRRMIAFSSIAQIGYIYMGIGLGTEVGMIAAVFHIFSHSVSKALVFISTIGLTDMSGYSRKFIRLTGAAYRNVIAGIGFTIASLSMVGVPLFAGFVSKLLFAQACVSNEGKLLPTMIVLAVSTILNAIYYLKTVIRIYVPSGVKDESRTVWGANRLYTAAIVGFVILNFTLGIFSQPFVDLITEGLHMFA